MMIDTDNPIIYLLTNDILYGSSSVLCNYENKPPNVGAMFNVHLILVEYVWS